MRKDIKASCKKRLSRIEGQVRGLTKMVDEDRYCIDIVTQIAAVRAALRRVEEEILKDHVSHCVEHAIASGDKADQRAKIAELMAVIGRAARPDRGMHGLGVAAPDLPAPDPLPGLVTDINVEQRQRDAARQVRRSRRFKCIAFWRNTLLLPRTATTARTVRR